MNIQELTSGLKTIYEERLEAVILYGSSADGEFHKGYSDINAIIILKFLAPQEIAKSGKIIKKWVKSGNPLPLFFSKETVMNSADVFPIEFFDIKEQHKVIYGIDPFQDIKIDARNLRHQCEFELRSKLLSLRQQTALLSEDPKALIKLILDSSSSFFAVFRGILRLAGARPKNAKKELAEQVSKLIGFDAGIFIEIVDVRQGLCIWRKTEANEKLEQYLTSIETTVNYIDKQ